MTWRTPIWKAVRAIALVCWLALSWSGAASGQDCEVPCDPGYSCIFGFCESIVVTCHEDLNPCPPGQMCIDNFCAPRPAPAACDPACDGSSSCYDGVCVPNASWSTLPLGAVAPSARSDAAYAFDPVRGRLVLFGGRGVSEATESSWVTPDLSDTWEFDGTTWTPIAVAGGPGAQPLSRMAYDPAGNRMILARPVESLPGNGDWHIETWSWNGALWTQLDPIMDPPVREGSFLLATDTARQRIVLNGSGFEAATWEWDGADWALMAGPLLPATHRPPAVSAMVYDAARSKVVALTANGGTETWSWDGERWRNMRPLNYPTAFNAASSLVYDPERRVVVLVGSHFERSCSSDSIWDWNDGDWTERAPDSGAPSGRAGAAIAYLPSRGGLVFFGGRDFCAPPPPNQLFSQTYPGLAMGDTWLVKPQGGAADTTPPVITCPVTFSAPAQSCAGYAGPITPATATDNADPAPTVTASPQGPYPIGSTLVTWTARDASGNQSTCEQMVMIDGAGLLASAFPREGGSATLFAGIADAYVNSSILDSNDPISRDALLSHWSIWAARSGRTQLLIYRRQGQGFTVVARSAMFQASSVGVNRFRIEPPISARAGDLIGWYAPGEGVVAFRDADGAPNAVYQTPVNAGPSDAGATRFEGTRTRRYAMTVHSGEPLPAPTLSQLAPISRNTDPGVCSATFQLPAPQASGGCGPLVLVAPPGANADGTHTFAPGTHTVVWTVTDATGYQATAAQSIEVTGPLPSSLTPISRVIDGETCTVTLQVPVPVVGGCGSLDLVPPVDANPDGTYTLEVGTHVFYWTLTDALSGFQATAEQIVNVTGPVTATISGPPAVTVRSKSNCKWTGSAGECSVVFNTGCDGSIKRMPKTALPLGTTQVTWTVTSSSGHMATLQQWVTVIDGEAPKFKKTLKPLSFTASNACGYTLTPGELMAPDATDTCETVTPTHNAPAILPIGETAIVWTASDSSGNSTTRAQVVTVLPPTLSKDLPKNLTNWWKFEEPSGLTVTDSIGGIQGVLASGAARVTRVTTCCETGAIELGSSFETAVDLGFETGNFGTKDFTVAFALKAAPAGATERAILADFAPAGGGFSLTLKANRLRFLTSIESNRYPIDSTVDVATDTWRHVILTRRSNRITLYVDGASAGSIADRAFNLSGASSFTIGRLNYASMVGQIDNLQIFSKGMTEAEAAALAAGACR